MHTRIASSTSLPLTPMALPDEGVVPHIDGSEGFGELVDKLSQCVCPISRIFVNSGSDYLKDSSSVRLSCRIPLKICDEAPRAEHSSLSSTIFQPR